MSNLFFYFDILTNSFFPFQIITKKIISIQFHFILAQTQQLNLNNILNTFHFCLID